MGSREATKRMRSATECRPSVRKSPQVRARSCSRPVTLALRLMNRSLLSREYKYCCRPSDSRTLDLRNIAGLSTSDLVIDRLSSKSQIPIHPERGSMEPTCTRQIVYMIHATRGLDSMLVGGLRIGARHYSTWKIKSWKRRLARRE